MATAQARMTVEKVGENGMRLTTVDVDPEDRQERRDQPDQPAPLVIRRGWPAGRGSILVRLDRIPAGCALRPLPNV